MKGARIQAISLLGTNKDKRQTEMVLIRAKAATTFEAKIKDKPGHLETRAFAGRVALLTLMPFPHRELRSAIDKIIEGPA